MKELEKAAPVRFFGGILRMTETEEFNYPPSSNLKNFFHEGIWLLTLCRITKQSHPEATAEGTYSRGGYGFCCE